VKRFLLVLVTGVLVVAGAQPAAGDVDSNPNAEALVAVDCPEAGLSFDAIWTPTSPSVSGHDLDSNGVGVVKSIYILGPDGTPLEQVFDTPGSGLDMLTVWCTWPLVGTPLSVGAHVLFNAHMRP